MLKFPEIRVDVRSFQAPAVTQIPETFDFSQYEDILSEPEPSFIEQETFYKIGIDEVLNYFTVVPSRECVYINFTREFCNLNLKQRKTIIFNITKILPKYVGCLLDHSTINQLNQEIAGLIYNLSILERSPGNFY